MKHIRALGLDTLAALFAVYAIATGSLAQSNQSGLKATLQSRYAAMKTAMAVHNDSAIAAILSPDFLSVDIQGQTESAPQMIAEVDKLPADPNKSSVTTILTIKSDAHSAIVKQQYDMKTIRAASDGSSHKIEFVTLSTDTWVKPSSVWLSQKTVTDEMSFFRDGQLVAHKP